jgi:glycosyltransferase involved in cell wall biosynthesis
MAAALDGVVRLKNRSSVLIASFKYSPVHSVLCLALGEPLRPLGFRVSYLLPYSLRWAIPDVYFKDMTFFGLSRNAKEVLWDTLAASSWQRSNLHRLLQQVRPSILLFESSHPANEVFATLARKMIPEIRIWMLIHEPYVREKSKHGWFRSLFITAQEWGVKRLVSYLDGVIVCSEEALRQTKVALPDFPGLVLKMPLLFEDRSVRETNERHSFSFIGHAVPAKGVDTFFRMIQSSADLGKEWEFQIASSTDVSHFLRALSENARAHLKVINHPHLSDEEIDQALRESWAVLAPYRRVTQSAVVPTAFMHGTPVISTPLGGMPESVIDGETGYLVDAEADFAAWEERFHQVQVNFARLSANCRQFFLDHFDANLGPRYLRPMLKSIR